MGGVRRPIRTALAVDDDAFVLDQYRLGLQRVAETRVRTATDVKTARRYLRSDPPDLAIVDLVLPDGSGIDLVAEIRVASPMASIVVVTGFGSIQTAVHAMRAGADDVVPKPIRIAEILKRALGERAPASEAPRTPTLDAALWQHIHRVLGDCDGNVSQAARRLGLHRSRLRRLLARHAPRL